MDTYVRSKPATREEPLHFHIKYVPRLKNKKGVGAYRRIYKDTFPWSIWFAESEAGLLISSACLQNQNLLTEQGTKHPKCSPLLILTPCGQHPLVSMFGFKKSVLCLVAFKKIKKPNSKLKKSWKRKHSIDLNKKSELAIYLVTKQSLWVKQDKDRIYWNLS